MPSTYTLIASNVLSSSAASVTFSAIPSTYTDLVLRISARTDKVGTNDDYKLTFNNLTTTIYSGTTVEGFSTTASSIRTTGYAYAGVTTTIDAANNTANTFASLEFYIPSYTASQNKPFSSIEAQEANSTTQVTQAAIAHLFRSTAAINSLKFEVGTGPNFVSGSSFYLYGISKS